MSWSGVRGCHGDLQSPGCHLEVQGGERFLPLLDFLHDGIFALLQSCQLRDERCQD